MDAFATHLPVLMWAVTHAWGDVLELGSGDYSTPVLHAVLADTGRRLVTMDHDENWLRRYQDLACDWHEVRLVEDWNTTDMERPWAVAFVDHAPGAQRGIDIQRLADWATLIVAHDTEPIVPFSGYGFDVALPLFKWRQDDKRQKPWTTVVSNKVSIPQLWRGRG